MQTAPLRSQPPRPRRKRSGRREWFLALVIVAVVVGAAGYAGLTALRHALTTPVTYSAGCQAGTGYNAVSLQTSQAQIAATIAAVAENKQLPAKALTVAYATALQESKLTNLSYGDRDSVGVFQQRPSQGWGTTAQLENPVYATTAFFDALVKISGYTKLSVATAAQDVQRSADGSAYAYYADEAAVLTSAFEGRGVTCWKGTGDATVKLNLHGAAVGLDAAFGTPGTSSVLDSIGRARSGKEDIIVARAGSKGTVASWLVANAATYGITRVSYGGYTWTEGTGSTTWRHDPSATVGGIVAS
jgi:hypothetical protein